VVARGWPFVAINILATPQTEPFVCLFLHFATQMLSNLLFLTLPLSVGFVSLVKERTGWDIRDRVLVGILGA